MQQTEHLLFKPSQSSVLGWCLLSVSILSSGCTSHHFANKQGQSETQFLQDKAYCQGLATGQGEGQTEGQRLIPYDECMRKLGYTE
ncbi:hypothetical protein QCB44_08690 [Thiomicrorhabdus sp. zzn3]|uniref:hypothetical protein n=1 Tax=Thiomicrorhabdus sp. zzn3 TaxID=3039775 RepID=UPI002436F597|nr:hypothetical protein [Thiomicrorhabdus sp. zzn3]MDG6778780.1 hypothetical protein [Thiomicrorhabdus sp. zzn3]